MLVFANNLENLMPMCCYYDVCVCEMLAVTVCVVLVPSLSSFTNRAILIMVYRVDLFNKFDPTRLVPVLKYYIMNLTENQSIILRALCVNLSDKIDH